MHIGIGIRLYSALRIAKEIHLYLLLILGLEIIHVDLSRNRLVAVFDRSTSLRHLNALHPRSRHIAQGIRDGSATEIRQVLGQHLDISARKAEQFDLSGSGSGIVVSHIHRRIGGETLSQVAAGRLEEFILVYRNAVHSPGQSGCSRFTGYNIHLLQHLVLEDGISRKN